MRLLIVSRKLCVFFEDKVEFAGNIKTASLLACSMRPDSGGASRKDTRSAKSGKEKRQRNWGGGSFAALRVFSRRSPTVRMPLTGYEFVKYNIFLMS